jgi:hypothetical protein
MKTFFAIFLIAYCTLPTWASADNLSNQSAPAGCPHAAEIGPLHLYGLWQAEFDGLSQGATLLFEKHAELADSVSGSIQRDGVKALLAGDVDAGELTLEESLDGQHIAATWVGTVVESSCGKEIRGIWNNPSSNAAHPFILRKQPGWH